jgi:hypothetical protein
VTTRSSWPPRWREHSDGDLGCMCPACGHYRRISSLAFLASYVERFELDADNDVEPDPYFDWSAPCPPGESEITGHEPCVATVPAKVRNG